MSDLSVLLAGPRYINGGFYSTRLHWDEAERDALALLCNGGADIERSAAALGRSPSSIAWRARDDGLKLPADWSRLIRPAKLIIVAEPAVRLSYPFIVRPRDEHADLLAVNAIVPRGLAGRDDICQEIMLALLEGKTTLDELRAARSNVGAFIRKVTKENFEGAGYALSLDLPMRDGRSWHEILSAETPSDVEANSGEGAASEGSGGGSRWATPGHPALKSRSAKP